MHRSQFLFWLLLSFIAGVALGSFWEIPRHSLYLAFTPGLAGVAVFWRRNWRLVGGAVLLIVFVGGVLQVTNVNSRQTFLRRLADGNFPSVLSGYVDSEITTKGTEQRFTLRVKQVRVRGFTIPERLDEKILVVDDAYPVRRYGQALTLTGVIQSPKNFSDFDYISYLARDQIFTLMRRPAVVETELSLSGWERGRVALVGVILQVKGKFETALAQAINEPSASLVGGLLLGTRQNLPAELRSDLSTVGLTHLLAISGYNITLVAWAVVLLLSWLLNRRYAFWLAVLAIAAFTVMTGAAASVVRSALMGVLVLLAQHSGRLYHPRNILTLVAGLMIMVNPLILRYDIGFQLSFLATIGLFYLAPFLNRWPILNNWPIIRSTLITTLGAQIMVLPLILFYFREFSWVAVPANLLILPFIPWLMLAGFLTGIAGLLWSGLGSVVGATAWLLTTIMVWLVKWLAAVPAARLPLGLNWWSLLLVYGLLIGALYWSRRRNNYFSDSPSNL